MINLPAEWLAAKEAENRAKDKRQELEDQMAAFFGFDPNSEGPFNFEQDGYTVKVVGRMNRKVDSDTLQELARENGLETYLQTLFKWEADVKLTAWKSTSPEITEKLAGAITTKPGRPSFSITVKEANQWLV